MSILWIHTAYQSERITKFFHVIIPSGAYMKMIDGMKDMIRFHHYSMDDILWMIPYEYQLHRMMIASDIQEAQEARNKQNQFNGMF